MSLASFESRLKRELQRRNDEHLLRSLESASVQNKHLDFSSNNYFALANDKDIACRFGDYFLNRAMGSGASRLVSGNHSVYAELERNLAIFKKTEAALVFGSGYLAAIGVIPNLCGKGDLVIADKHIHKSSLDAIKLSGAKLVRYEHNNNNTCLNILKNERGKYQNCVIVTETLFSMDGDYADVKGLYNFAEEYDALLLLDDAHGLGVFEDYPEKFTNRLVIMGTMSKALGSYGGYVACSELLRSYLVNNASSLIYSTSLPEIAVLWANHALKSLSECKRLDLLGRVEFLCRNLGISNPKSPIVIIPYTASDKVLKVKQLLLDRGIVVGAIRPPASRTPRLRIAISLCHKYKDLLYLSNVLQEQI